MTYEMLVAVVAQEIWAGDPGASQGWQYIGDQKREAYYAQARRAIAVVRRSVEAVLSDDA